MADVVTGVALRDLLLLHSPRFGTSKCKFVGQSGFGNLYTFGVICPADSPYHSNLEATYDFTCPPNPKAT